MDLNKDFFKFIGIPFVDNEGDYKGCNCWGLVKLIYKDLYGIILPEYSIACDDKSRINSTIDSQRIFWEKCDPTNIPVPSIIVMRFNSPNLCNHIGVYIGNHEFIHTARRVNSHITSIDNPAWNRRIEGFYTLKEEFKCMI